MGDDPQTIKVLYVSPFSHIGGGEVSLLTILRNLDKGRVRPSLICYEDGPFVNRARESGIETYIFRRSGFISEFKIVRDIICYVRTNGVDLVHVNSLDIRAGIAARIAGIPCIGHLRVIFPFTWRDRLFVRLSAITIAVSNAVVEDFSRGSSYYQSKMIVMPNMVELPAEIRPAKLREEFGIPGGSLLIGMAGRMDPYKGHDVFIDAAAIIKKSLPNAVFLVIGAPLKGDRREEEYFESIKKRAGALGIAGSVIFTGFRDDILNAIAALDVMVVPSIIIRKGSALDTEGFGRVAIEAMAVNVPVVSTTAGGLKEIIEDGISGTLVPVEDAKATAEAVICLLQDKPMADVMKATAKRRFEDLYSLRSMDKLHNFYFDIINKIGRRG